MNANGKVSEIGTKRKIRENRNKKYRNQEEKKNVAKKKGKVMREMVERVQVIRENYKWKCCKEIDKRNG